LYYFEVYHNKHFSKLVQRSELQLWRKQVL